MTYAPENPLIVQSDMSMLLEVNSPIYEEARDAVAPFAEIIKSPEYVHTYKITPISLWNASSAGLNASDVMGRLERYSKYEVSHSLAVEIKDLMSRFGKFILRNHNSGLKLSAEDPLLLTQMFHTEDVSRYFAERIDDNSVVVDPVNRGLVKQALIKAGYPALDMAGYRKGARLELELKTGGSFNLRPYQAAARESFLKGGTALGGNGVIVLACGSGKTIVGISVMEQLKTHTLILCTGITAIRQWKAELLRKTTLSEDDIGEYSGECKQLRPVTLASYQILTHRKSREADFTHFNTLNSQPWGLAIYDEVHLLPAQVFRFAASLQAIRRLGLTATLVREDGREADVFSLIGPKCFDVPWKVIEKQGWIAEAQCFEIRVEITGEARYNYVNSNNRRRFRVASENPEKMNVIRKLLDFHKGEHIIIIGQYLDQLRRISEEFNITLITGQTPQDERDRVYAGFKAGEFKSIVVSSVANFAVDLPDASVAIQVSGKFGSRQEEAQRLGRILRPKLSGRHARFYTLVTADTREQDFALNRQMFLTEQGYSYNILSEDEIKEVLKGDCSGLQV